jgi:hypothetical protein
MRFVAHRVRRAPGELTPVERAQLVPFGVLLDGVSCDAARRFQLSPELELCDVVDGWRVRYSLWMSTDGGVVFHGGSPDVVAPIVQYGFASNHLGAWLDLEAATGAKGSFELTSWVIGEESAPIFYRVAGDSLRGAPSVTLYAWRELLDASDDPDVRAFITGAGARPDPSLRAPFGPALVVDPALVARAAPRLPDELRALVDGPGRIALVMG